MRCPSRKTWDQFWRSRTLAKLFPQRAWHVCVGGGGTQLLSQAVSGGLPRTEGPPQGSVHWDTRIRRQLSNMHPKPKTAPALGFRSWASGNLSRAHDPEPRGRCGVVVSGSGRKEVPDHVSVCAAGGGQRRRPWHRRQRELGWPSGPVPTAAPAPSRRAGPAGPPAVFSSVQWAQGASLLV